VIVTFERGLKQQLFVAKFGVQAKTVHPKTFNEHLRRGPGKTVISKYFYRLLNQHIAVVILFSAHGYSY